MDNYRIIPTDKIRCESNRESGGMGDIESLAESIKRHGLINPITVAEDEVDDGVFRVIAGRRRFAAVRFLGLDEIAAVVIDRAEPGLLSEIAVAENTARLETHPLDEADTFKTLLDEGSTLKELSKRFSRTVSEINKRIKLCALVEGARVMFREGLMDLTGAALIAHLSAEEQERFVKKYGGKKTHIYEARDFVSRSQKHSLDYFFRDDKKCAVCKDRTYLADEELFSESGFSRDFCLCAECYSEQWALFIGGLIGAETGACELETENNLFIDGGLPPFYPKGAKTISIYGEEYGILSERNFSIARSDKKTKKNTAWRLKAYPELSVERVNYKEHRVFRGEGKKSGAAESVKEYGLDLIPDFTDEERAKYAAKIKEKFPYGGWQLLNLVGAKTLHYILQKRIKEESKEDLAKLFFDHFCNNIYNEVNQTWLTSILGIDNIEDVEAPEEAQKLFLFLLAQSFEKMNRFEVPSDEEEWALYEDTCFWRFAQISREEYMKVYTDFLKDLVLKEAGKTNEQRKKKV